MGRNRAVVMVVMLVMVLVLVMAVVVVRAVIGLCQNAGSATMGLVELWRSAAVDRSLEGRRGAIAEAGGDLRDSLIFLLADFTFCCCPCVCVWACDWLCMCGQKRERRRDEARGRER